MTNPSDIDLGSDGADFHCYAMALDLASVCSTSEDAQVAADEMNRRVVEGLTRLGVSDPTGTPQWMPSEDKFFAGGQPNPCACDKHDGHFHHLLIC